MFLAVRCFAVGNFKLSDGLSDVFCLWGNWESITSGTETGNWTGLSYAAILRQGWILTYKHLHLCAEDEVRYFCGWLAYSIVSIMFSVLPVPELLIDLKSVLFPTPQPGSTGNFRAWLQIWSRKSSWSLNLVLVLLGRGLYSADLHGLQFSQLCSVVWIRVRRKDILEILCLSSR